MVNMSVDRLLTKYMSCGLAVTTYNCLSGRAVFEGDERGLWLATRTEPERDSWIERLHIAGFECLRIQLESLREQLKARTGHDPIEFGGLAVEGVRTADSTSGRSTFDKHCTHIFVARVELHCSYLKLPSSYLYCMFFQLITNL